MRAYSLLRVLLCFLNILADGCPRAAHLQDRGPSPRRRHGASRRLGTIIVIIVIIIMMLLMFAYIYIYIHTCI